MTIAPALINYPMNEEQRAIISHKQGPLLIIAGPGSGKTRSLTLLAMNLLLCGDAQPSELILCTYTEKAAHEMQDRLMQIARNVDYKQDLAPLRIGTIHGICKQLIAENTHHLRIENEFATLDQFTRQFLIFGDIDKICTSTMKLFFQKQWGSLWQVAKELGSSFDKITEELLFEKLETAYKHISAPSLHSSNDRLRLYLTHAYAKYQRLLEQRNCLDFAHLQKCIYNLLHDPTTFPHVTRGIRYVLVDEYQDTNYIQEQILTMLASTTSSNNLFVVGDEDQALYRFRGATVRNILEFAQKFPNCKQIHLMTNYRSHPGIIESYNTWIASIEWSNPGGPPFRTEKSARASHNNHTNYPAVCTMTHMNIHNEAEQFAKLAAFLKEQGRIKDYSQIALLLRSVKPEVSTPYIQALKEQNIPYFCPRAMSYFANDQVCLMIGCFAYILDFEDECTAMLEDDPFPDYLHKCREQLKKALLLHIHLHATLFQMREEIRQGDQQSEVQGKSLIDYFYRLMVHNPFLISIKEASDNAAQPYHLEILSQLLQTFHHYYSHANITQQNYHSVAYNFFQKFLILLYNDGHDHYETSSQSLPEGHVPILTIHQAKGLEFPIVVVGRLDQRSNFSDSQKHKALQELSLQPSFEPNNRIPGFDLCRLYYVAFSRAKSLLILTAVRKPMTPLTSLWQRLPSLSQAIIRNIPKHDELEKHFMPQPRYALTSHIQLYKTCPRQFQFFHVYKFSPNYNETLFLGQLVHYTLEHIHRCARDGGLAALNEETIYKIFERKFRALMQFHLSPIDDREKNQAWQQILRYFLQNREILQNIIAAELPVQVTRDDYVLTGKIDLLVKTSSGFDLIDFKTQPRQNRGSAILEQYEHQLHFYAHAVEQYKNQRPERLYLYWTAEERIENALMEIPFQIEKVKKLSRDLERVVLNIKEEKFHVKIPPIAEICQRCDIRHLCRQDGVIEI